MTEAWDHPGRILALAAIASVFLLVSGCGSSASSQSPSTLVNLDSSKPVANAGPSHQPANMVPGLPERIALGRVDDADPNWVLSRLGASIVHPDGTGLQSLDIWGGATAWSPDQTRVAAGPSNDQQASTLFSLDATGAVSAQVNLPAVPLAWSPDGKQMAYRVTSGLEGSSYQASLAVGQPDGTSIRAIAGGYASSAVWSPDGGYIAFGASDYSFINGRDFATPEGSALIVIRPDGTGEKTVVATGSEARNRLTIHDVGGWSSDGGSIYFSAADASGNVDIYAVRVSGGVPTALVRDPQNDDYPVLSPDGRSIAFCSNRTGTYQVYVAGIDGNHPQQITRGSDGGCPTAWLAATSTHPSPEPATSALNGTAIVGAFDSDSNEFSNLMAVALDGSSSEPFAPSLLADQTISMIALSRTTASVLYTDNVDGLFVGDPTNGDKRMLSASGDRAQIVAWSPDGKRVAYVDMGAYGGGYPTANGPLLAIVNIDGSDRRVIAAASSFLIDQLAWTSDSQSVLVYNPYGEKAGLYQISIPSGSARRISSLRAFPSPSGPVLFIGDDEGSPACRDTVWIAVDATSKPRLIDCLTSFDSDMSATSASWNVVWSADGSQAAVLQNDGSLWLVDGAHADLIHAALPRGNLSSTAVWTPDGAALIYGNLVMRPDGGGLAPLQLSGVDLEHSVILGVR